LKLVKIKHSCLQKRSTVIPYWVTLLVTHNLVIPF
jgi:hypothetical protein